MIVAKPTSDSPVQMNAYSLDGFRTMTSAGTRENERRPGTIRSQFHWMVNAFWVISRYDDVKEIQLIPSSIRQRPAAKEPVAVPGLAM